MRAAWRLNEKEGLAKFRQIAGWLEHDYPDAARSLLEGLEECFTINRLDVPRSLHRCLATSNIVDNPHSGVRSRTRRVCRWRPGMSARWSAAAFLEGEKKYRKIMGYRDLWALKAILDGSQPATRQAVVFRLSWKWRKRSAVKIAERTHEEDTQALHRRGKGRHPEAASIGAGAGLEAL
jgi:hypothetical protein